MSQSVSVIIPAYQAELTIRRCVRSALDIGSALREVIVVDDGSTDATASIVREMESLDSRVSCISQENRGRASARNAGFAASRGDWIMFLDADDCLVSADYESFVGAIDEKGLGLAIFMYTKCELSYPGYQDAESAVSTAQYVSSNELFQAMICGGCDRLIEHPQHYEFNSVWSRFYKRDVIEGVVEKLGDQLAPFPLGLRFSEDRLFNLEYLWQLSRGTVGFFPICAYYWDVEKSGTCNRLSSLDVRSLFLFAEAAGKLKDKSVLASSEEPLVVSREFMEQLKRTITMAKKDDEIISLWLSTFDSSWLRLHLRRFPSDCLGRMGEWRLAAGLLSHGYLRETFGIYRYLIEIKAFAKRLL